MAQQHIEIEISSQKLRLLQAQTVQREFLVSTAENGINNQDGSGGTPIGQHIIRAKIGANAPVNSVFVGRRQTGEIYNAALDTLHPKRDWILTRILWLSGCEPGHNRLGNCDTMRRYIYIHGTPDKNPMGVALSHGCIRMRNDDIIALFDLVEVGCPVNIYA